MDPQLLALLPDAAKLGILRHLSGGQPAAPPASSQQQKQQGPRRQQQHASVLPAVAGRTLEGGLAVIDGFLDCDEVEVRVWGGSCGLTAVVLLPAHSLICRPSSRHQSSPCLTKRLILIFH